MKTFKSKTSLCVIFMLLFAVLTFGIFINNNNKYIAKADGNEITVNLYDGYSNNLLGTSIATVGETFSFFVPTRSNYSFQGWKYQSTLITGSNGIGLSIWTITDSPTTLNASWLPDIKTIQFDSGDVSISINNTTIGYGTRKILPHDFDRAGYNFVGWFDSLSETGTQYSISDGTMIRDWDKEAPITTLYAKWSPITYTITYILDGGTNSADNPSTYNIQNETIVLNNATKQDYRFMGWYIGDTRIYSIPSGSYGNLTLTAVWELEYTLIFTANNLSADYWTINGQYATINAIYGETILLPDVNFGGFILKSGNYYYAQGTSFTVTSNKNFELVEKNSSQLYDSSTGYYDIWTYNQFNSIVRSYRSSNYKLKANITQPENTVWTPIGTFSGTLKGENHWINNLKITYGLSGSQTTISRQNYGLFENNTGRIENLGISQGAFGLYTYTATYSTTPVYCGFISARNSGTITGCSVLGSFFQFAYIAPYITSYSGAICGYNSGTVENCEVFETGIQLTTGFGGGIVGHNYGGTITNCEIGLSGVSCYQEFQDDNSNGYSDGHYAAVGGIVGYAQGGTISGCSIASNVDIDYNGYSSNSRTLAPELGVIAGRSSTTTTFYSNTANGETGTGNGLQVVTWHEGWWIFGSDHSWDQAQYVGGNIGRYV